MTKEEENVKFFRFLNEYKKFVEACKDHMDPNYFQFNVLMVTTCNVYIYHTMLENNKAKEFIDNAVNLGKESCVELMKDEYKSKKKNSWIIF